MSDLERRAQRNARQRLSMCKNPNTKAAQFIPEASPKTIARADEHHGRDQRERWHWPLSAGRARPGFRCGWQRDALLVPASSVRRRYQLAMTPERLRAAVPSDGFAHANEETGRSFASLPETETALAGVRLRLN